MSDEKTEEPSEQKLEKANEEGNFPKSQEVSATVVFGAGLLMLLAGGRMLFEQFEVLVRAGLNFSANNMSPEEILVKSGIIYTSALWLIVPVALVSVAAGVIGTIIQIGFKFSMKPLEPKLENISPVKGIKKIFSIKSVLELLQMMVRAFVIGAVAWWLIRNAMSLFSGAAYQSIPVLGEVTWLLVTRLLKYALLAFLIMSGIDYALQRWQFMKGQRMSKDEVKREWKESEGDPLIKSARMQLARENAQSGGNSRGNLQHANAILTNPTHYAVAVAYEPGLYDVPFVVARGADLDAKELREEGARLGIPIFSNPPLARALYRTEVGKAIPKEFFGVVAALLIWLRQLDRLNKSYVDLAAERGGSA